VTVKRLACLLALAFLPTGVAHADGCPPSTCGTSSSAVPGSRILALRPNGSSGPLVGYDLVTKTKRFTLGSGRLSADGTRFFRAIHASSDTRFPRYDGQTGELRSVSSIRGKWSLGGISPTGRWLVAIRYSRKSTHIALVDPLRGQVRGTVTLRGNNEVETVSPDGRRLFLVHYRRAGYDLRQYDFDTRRLQATRLADPDEKMSGTAWGAIATRDGRWLLTLYLKPDGTAFVHALDLRRGIAHCIDLPDAENDFSRLGSFAMTLSPDERTLYMANPLLGVVDAIDLAKLRLGRTAHFPPQVSGVEIGIGPNAAVSPNGRMLYFSGGRFLWAYDTAYGKVRGPYAVAPVNQGLQIAVAGLGFAPDGRRVVTVRSDRRLVGFNAATGRRTG
jgi:hypothetical protein